ncbi:MAG: DUF1778 domain-containing protein [Chloroflexota bacterium]
MTTDAALTGRRFAPPATTSKTERITVRVSVAQRKLLSEASRTESTTLTDFILDAATARAEDVLADRSVFSLNHEAFAAFVDLLDRPVVDKPRLRERLSAQPLFDK